jgi:hypothetical protein
VRTLAAEALGAAAIAAAAAPASNNGAIECSLILIVQILCVWIVCLGEFGFGLRDTLHQLVSFTLFSIISSQGQLASFESRRTARSDPMWFVY